MSVASNQPDLIISLSRDKVTLDLSGNPDQRRYHWRTSFPVDGLFLEEQISGAIDEILTENPDLIDQFPCVEILLMDSPGVSIPAYYLQAQQAVEIASRYLKARKGDLFSIDQVTEDLIMCYTIPFETLRMLREYYSNCNVTHLNSLVTHSISYDLKKETQDTITYFILVRDTLIIMASENDHFIFSKSFSIREEGDLTYFSLACSRMLQSRHNWLVTIENEEPSFDFPTSSILKVDQVLSLPSLHVLMSRYKPCVS